MYSTIIKVYGESIYEESFGTSIFFPIIFYKLINYFKVQMYVLIYNFQGQHPVFWIQKIQSAYTCRLYQSIF